MNANQSSSLIDALGGTAKVAKMCEVSPQAVSKWRVIGIPRARLMYLKVKKPRVVAQVEKGVATL